MEPKKDEREMLNVGQSLKKSMIWTSTVPSGQQAYVAFRKILQLPMSPRKAMAHIFADSRYILWINGYYVGRGPARFDPRYPEYDTLDIKKFLRKGKNAISVLVHHYAGGKNGRIMEHIPGLGVRIDIEYENGDSDSIFTDPSWVTYHKTRYLPSSPSWGVIPDNIDARRDDGDWTLLDYDDSHWIPSISIDGSAWGNFKPRSVPLLEENEISFKRIISPERGLSVIEKLPLKLRKGEKVYLDFGEVIKGYSILHFEAEEGTHLEIGYGHYFQNNKIIYHHSPKSYYIAREGLQNYMGGDILAFQYLTVEVKEGLIKLLNAKAVSRTYPYKCYGKFSCNETKLNDVWQACVKTVLLCCEDTYTDCAIRERVLWTADTVICSYPISRLVFSVDDSNPRSDAKLLKRGLRLIAQSQQIDGRIKAHHPSDRWDIHGYVEDGACLWIQGLKDYVDNTGDITLIRELWQVLERQLQWFIEHRSERGLIEARELVYVCNPLCYKTGEFTALNSYVYSAFCNAAYLAKLIGNEEKHKQYAEFAELIYQAINSYLWNDKEGTYDGGIFDGKRANPTAHAAIIALYFNVVPKDRRPKVEKWLVEHFREVKFWPYLYFYLFKVLYEMRRDDIDSLILDIIREKWYPIIDEGFSVVFENFGGKKCKDAFVHQMGSAPALFLSSWVLGVRVDEPVSNKRILVEPHLGDLEYAEGVVLTEFGKVSVYWEKDTSINRLLFKIELPKHIHALLSLPRLSDSCTIILNDKQVMSNAYEQISNGNDNRYFRLRIKGGVWKGEIIDERRKYGGGGK